MTLTLLLICVSLLLCGIFGNRAPDKAPDLPEGWCKNGAPTKTTGECICSALGRVCEGSRCIDEQGFSFYSGVTCPDCKCVKRVKVEETAPRQGSIGDSASPDEMMGKQRTRIHSSPPPPDNTEEEEDNRFSLGEFIEDYGNAVIGIVFLLFIIITLVVTLMMTSNNVPPRASATSNKQQKKELSETTTITKKAE